MASSEVKFLAFLLHTHYFLETPHINMYVYVYTQIISFNFENLEQVAEWMGRREAWSAEKPTDSRTKPTRWEFHNGREQFNENVVKAAVNSNEGNRRKRSAEEQRRHVNIK